MTPTRFPHSGLYVIIDPQRCLDSDIVAATKAAIRGGAKVIQLRDKGNQIAAEIVAEMRLVCRQAGLPFIINDNVDLAAAIAADGVHLGQDDDQICSARKSLGKASIVGVSCYSSISRAHEAERNGANYVAFGRFFPSQTKPHAPSVSIEILRQTKVRIPIVAIGGINADNGRSVLDAGADLLAVVDAVIAQTNIEQSAAAFHELFGKSVAAREQ